MRKRFGPVRVRRFKYPLLLTNDQADLRRGGRKTDSYGPFKSRDYRDKDNVSDTPRRARLKICDSDSRPVSVRKIQRRCRFHGQDMAVFTEL